MFKVKISGSAEFNGAIESNSFSARISGSDKNNITGSSQEAKIGIADSGKFNGTEFRINDCSINISGSGKAKVFVEDKLNDNSGSGCIQYRGNPKFDFKYSGSGRLERIE